MRTRNSLKYSLLLFTCFYHLNFLNAQVTQLGAHQMIGIYQLDLIKDALVLTQQEMLPTTENKCLNLNVRLYNNELLISYQLDDPGEEGYYIVDLEIEMDGQSIQPHSGFLLGDLGKINVSGNEAKQIIWTQVISDLPDAAGELELTVKIEWWGRQYLAYGVNCNEYPTFGFRQKIPFYAGLVGGLGGLVGGAVIKNNAGKHLERHKTSNVLSERMTEYDNYVDQLQAAEIVTYVSIGIIAADALFYFLRKKKHKKRVRVFEEFCNTDRMSVQPFWNVPTASRSQEIGFHFSYQF